MSEAVEEYVSSLRGKSQHTKRMYKSQLDMFETVMGTKPVKKWTFPEIMEFLDFLDDEDRSSGTVAQYTIVLRQFFEFHGRDDIAKKIKTPKITREVRSSVKSEYWMDMFEAAGFHHENGDRNQALLSVLLGTGMRVSEAVKIRGKHIDWPNERIFVPQAKGDREVYYMMVLLDEIEQYLKPWAGQKTEGYIFPGKKWNKHLTDRMARYIVRRIAVIAGVPNAEHIGPHSLRHSLAKYLLFEEEWDSMVVKEILNHKRITTTQIYVQLEEGSLELVDFVKRNRPGA